MISTKDNKPKEISPQNVIKKYKIKDNKTSKATDLKIKHFELEKGYKYFEGFSYKPDDKLIIYNYVDIKENK